MNSPNPVPTSDLDTNFEKIFGSISRSIPGPQSLTSTITCDLSFKFLTETFSLLNFIALSNRLTITYSIFSLSALTKKLLCIEVDRDDDNVI